MLSKEQLHDVVSQGYRLFPLTPGTKVPLKDSKGVIDATHEEHSITSWFTRHKGCNWGIAGGHIYDSDEFIIFIDVDTKTGKSGQQELDTLIEQYGNPPDTFTVETPSGGLHYYFRTTIKHARYRARLKGCRHIDIKCEGGYVVLFGSETPEGAYTVVSGSLDRLAYLEDWFGSDTESLIFGDIERDYTRIGKIKLHDGQWSYFTSLAGKLRSDGLVGDSLFAALWDKAQAVGDPVPDQWWIKRIARGYSEYDDMFDATDRGNGQRLLATFGHNLRYIPHIGWFVWNGKQWLRDSEGLHVEQLAERLVPTIRAHLTLLDAGASKGLKAQLAKSAAMLSSQGARKNMVLYTKSTPFLWLEAEDFDNEPHLLNTQNGIVNLDTGHKEPHDPSMMCSRIAAIDYDAEAQCPRFMKFLDEITCGDAELQEWLQVFFGYCLTGNTSEQLFTVFYGTGSNGKSVLMNVITHILGDYALESPSETIMLRKNPSSNSNDLARLRGARLATVRETSQGQRLDESLVKSLTGGDKIVARFLHKEFFEFHSLAKWVLFTNHKPIIRGTDDGIWRRLRLVPFKLHVPTEKQDHDLEKKLLNEAPGILNWMIAGAMQWRNYGFPNCIIIQSETHKYRNSEDLLYEFLDECTEKGHTYKAERKVIFERYLRWCQESGTRNTSKKLFSERLEEQGFYVVRGYKGYFYSGIKLKDDNENSTSSTDF